MGTLRITSDGDPFPAKAGGGGSLSIPPVNDGTTRAFTDGSVIQDQSHDYSIRYRAGSNTIDSEAVTKTAPIGITTTGVLIYTSGYSDAFLPVSTSAASSNFTWNMGESSLSLSEFSLDLCGGKPESNGEYRYRTGAFYKNGLLNNTVFNASTGSTGYFSDSNSFGGNENLRHAAKTINSTAYTGGHSKILGFAFDGYPIYGPYGYSSPTDPTSAVARMTSSYRTKDVETGGRGYTYSEKPAGSFIEDFEYVSALGTLDEFNGRFCKTPDYDTGTYAYFLTFSDDNLDNPAYPYIIGPSTREQRSA